MVEAEWDSEYFSLDARRNRELFARYGYAMHNAQCLEKQLAIMLALADPEFFAKCPQVRNSLFDAALSEIFCAIWKKLSAVVPFGKDVADRIYEAKTARNYLAHNYFWQHAADLLDARKQELLIEELTAIANRFKKLDDELVRITEAYAYRMGVTEEQISHELELLKSQDG